MFNINIKNKFKQRFFDIYLQYRCHKFDRFVRKTIRARFQGDEGHNIEFRRYNYDSLLTELTAALMHEDREPFEVDTLTKTNNNNNM